MPTPKFPELEVQMLARWEAEKLFEKTSEKNRDGKPFVFFEGPPTANGRPGVHHMLPRAFKDVVPRFQSMRGRRVDRKGGWDTHGLPVELQVEKALGISGKGQIENLVAGDARASIIEFNKKCKESVWEFLDDWIKMSHRMGYWVDTDNAYVTYTNDYIESLWSVLKRVHARGLLYQGHKVVPHCPRCGTALSSHEVAQGYKTVTDESVFVKFKLVGEEKTFLLGWTTTPWTLPGNVALAVGDTIEYVRVRVGDEQYVLAEALVEKVFEGAQQEVIAQMKGTALVGLAYEPLFSFLAGEIKPEERANAFKVYAADFVTTTDGTGIVHTAVMYGEDDYQLGHKIGLPKLHTVGEDGKFLSFVTPWAGKFVKSETVEQEAIANLRERGLLLRSEKYEHEYPFCWRCATPLLYYAKDSWFIKMSELSGELQARNATVHWVPEHIRDGRFGEWLKNVKDWAISRERYWGTPLPIWKCNACAAFDVLGSIAEIKEKGMVAPDDLHRPFVDDISYACDCGGVKSRVKEVADCWFDSGAMFVAQWGYQWGIAGEAKKNFESHYPADYISEAIDQTRGWFYTLLACATLLELPAPYKNVVCLSHILDAKGQKMSKSKGNVVDPWKMFEEYGADAVRFHLYSMSQPGDPKLFDTKGVDDVVKKVFLIMWNVLEFYKLYSDTVASERNTIHPLDSWLEARLQKTVNYVTEQLELSESTNASRELAAFVTDLSTWYVRRSRGRFKNGGADAAAAAAMLRHTLITVSKLFAPFTPMIADAVHREIVGADKSVHLEEWPAVGEVNESALANMELIRALVTQALEQRAKSGIPIRQVLGKLTVPQSAAPLASLFEILQEEVNVESIELGDALALDIEITPELREKGMVRELVRHINATRKERGLKPGESITFTMQCAPEFQALVERNSAAITAATASTIVFAQNDQTQAQKIEIGEFICFIA
ncbi:MAG: hypothetical protein A2848_01700 [Candidatus Magasanikbacteria bacterium RIFCSPHIGHO2_01_FULL_50_8]|uniref:Isoleucine--tRNA ligase n=2 Tax=Candidatus Magasanikiibacteriota TaxID=1752731 RepID=A0A1F6LVJ2_9BACT|nr:MAG: hypothetical protein A2848_01700 [Candidatus Magasanikbacteria bacterium RIFCSPHIGHO2_01_FULL_50_8]OGH68225.1 MAG: hypothetical protein A3C15_01220 [Candidatus Magasanikbacteria bacterium RIFCSPHIGHO2_02_FULL_50_9b]